MLVFLGYVNDANKWVIWTDDKSLYRNIRLLIFLVSEWIFIEATIDVDF
jgi:hypothetical protein